MQFLQFSYNEAIIKFIKLSSVTSLHRKRHDSFEIQNIRCSNFKQDKQVEPANNAGNPPIARFIPRESKELSYAASPRDIIVTSIYHY